MVKWEPKSGWTHRFYVEVIHDGLAVEKAERLERVTFDVLHAGPLVDD